MTRKIRKEGGIIVDENGFIQNVEDLFLLGSFARYEDIEESRKVWAAYQNEINEVKMSEEASELLLQCCSSIELDSGLCRLLGGFPVGLVKPSLIYVDEGARIPRILPVQSASFENSVRIYEERN